MGIGFVFLVASFYEVNLAAAPQMIALFLFAQVAGFLALFAPGGIGVRDGIIMLGLQPIVGPGPAIVVTGIARLWQTVLELITAAMGWQGIRPGKSNDELAGIENQSLDAAEQGTERQTWESSFDTCCTVGHTPNCDSVPNRR